MQGESAYIIRLQLNNDGSLIQGFVELTTDEIKLAQFQMCINMLGFQPDSLGQVVIHTCYILFLFIN